MARSKRTAKPRDADQDQMDRIPEPETEDQEQDIPRELETTEPEQDIPQGPKTTEPDMFAKIPTPCVYCGPSVRGVARQYTTYQGGISDALRKFIKEHPQALGLIVAARKFPAMRKQLETPGTPEAELYKAVKVGVSA